jgi:hypothetical protein
MVKYVNKINFNGLPFNGREEKADGNVRNKNGVYGKVVISNRRKVW